jgi:hypothetical protein
MLRLHINLNLNLNHNRNPTMLVYASVDAVDA